MNKIIAIMLAIIICGCSKEETVMPDTKALNPFGVLVNQADSISLPINQFKVPYTRTSVAIPNWNGTLISYEQYANEGGYKNSFECKQ